MAATAAMDAMILVATSICLSVAAGMTWRMMDCRVVIRVVGRSRLGVPTCCMSMGWLRRRCRLRMGFGH